MSRIQKLSRVSGCLCALVLGMQIFTLSSLAQSVSPVVNSNIVISVEGKVEVRLAGATNWLAARVGQAMEAGYQLRTGPKSRAAIRLSNLSVLRVGELMQYEIEPPRAAGNKPVINVKAGSAYFFSRDQPQELQIRTPVATGAIRGTEFNLTVADDGKSTLTLVDGEVELANAEGSLRLTNGEEAVVENQRAPVRTARLEAVNVIQWTLYYPAVLDVGELRLSQSELEILTNSLAAYRQGDLPEALRKYPENHQPESASEHLYLAGLLLSVGLVEQSEVHLAAASVNAPGAEAIQLANALRQLIAAVKFKKWESSAPPQLASEWLAESYYQQSRAELDAALAAARKAVEKSPEFGFAWERVAELEFCFGHTERALETLRWALSFAPRNGQAVALKGFLLSSQNQIDEAILNFDKAIVLDAALGNAWLGRGLCRIRRGDTAGGRSDLLVAAALEPQRSVLRSYLGKAWADAGDNEHAAREIKLALRLDPADPTGWLYAALLKQQQNRINEGIGDLEKSQALNDNRALFRSKLLLDQDKAVRSANLAGMYRDAGMSEVGLREAAKAVTYDYANDSAHLFLSDSFNELRDPTRFNLRQETVWFNELLLANLLAPVGAGRLSQTVTANEYSKLFESDGVGMASQASWRSDDQFRQLVSQYGTFGKSSWAFDLDYQHNAGVRPNNELDRLEWYTTLKQQLTPQDTVLMIAKYQDYSSGDNFQYYNPATSYRPNFKFVEKQEPILIGGYQHEWSPGVRTLLLGGRLVNEQNFSDRQTPQLLLIENSAGAVAATDAQPFDVKLSDKLEIYTAELNQIFQREKFTVVAGGLWQGGDFDFSNSLSNSPLPAFFLPPVNASFSEPFERLKAYGYLTVEPLDRLWLTAGVAYDQLEMPSNFRSVPQSAGTEKRHLVEPKAAIVWSPLEQATLRGIYSKSLGGVSLDESYRLEPTQLAGFAQDFRTVISESIAGSVAAPETEVLGLALDLKLGRNTFIGLQAGQICSDVQRSVGVFRLVNSLAPFVPSTTQEILNYEEQSFSINVNQLLGDGFVVGANYRLTHADLKSTLPEVPVSALAGAARDESAYLHQIGGYLLYNHPSGFFSRFDARYYQQSNRGYTPDQPGDSFVQLDLQAGYRFFRRRAELSLGILNLTDQDYRLNPLTIYTELPRQRVFTARFSFRF